jgi:hypothetical protein
MDPSDQGGAYNLVVKVVQDGKEISEVSASGNIPPGKGKADFLADEIQLTNADQLANS